MDVSKLKEDIKKNRPKITESSISTYTSILKNLFKKFHKDGDEFNINWFENEDAIIKHLKDVKPNIRKTLYSSLISITDDKHNKKYKKAMMEDAEHYRSENLKQNKTEAQEKNWVTQDDVKKKVNEMMKSIRGLWNKDDLTKQEYYKLQDLILVSLTSGIFIPPRRAVDWVDFVIKDIDEKNDNYLKKDEFHFNKYKGSDKKGEQVVKVPKELLTLIRKFIKVNPHKYLLVDTQNKKMNSIKLNQHLERIWGKKAGVNIFRHSFISEKYPIFNVDELKKDAEKMGSSANMMLDTYIKKT
jgi:integrase